jgi:hypothetical protein
MQQKLIGIALVALAVAAPVRGAVAQATTNVGNTQKGSVAPKKSGEGSGTAADSARYLAATVKAYPPCQGGKLPAANVGSSVTGSPGGMGSPDQSAPLPSPTTSRRKAKADSARAVKDSVPNCATIADSLKRMRKQMADTTRRP